MCLKKTREWMKSLYKFNISSSEYLSKLALVEFLCVVLTKNVKLNKNMKIKMVNLYIGTI